MGRPMGKDSNQKGKISRRKIDFEIAERWTRQEVEIRLGGLKIGSPLGMEAVSSRRPARPFDAMRKGHREEGKVKKEAK